MDEQAYRAKVRESVCASIISARRREEKKRPEGRRWVEVKLTQREIIEIVEQQNYVCALTGMRFWDDDSNSSYGPAIPSLDRIDPDGLKDKSNARSTARDQLAARPGHR